MSQLVEEKIIVVEKQIEAFREISKSRSLTIEEESDMEELEMDLDDLKHEQKRSTWRKIDLGRLFVNQMKAGGYAPKIEADRVAVIYDDGVYYAYKSNSLEQDMLICGKYIDELERESGLSGEKAIAHENHVSKTKMGGLPKNFQSFDGDFESELYLVISIGE